jgi:MoxR-like ATPase
MATQLAGPTITIPSAATPGTPQPAPPPEPPRAVDARHAATTVTRSTQHGPLRELGIVGYDQVEPVVLAALATETPLLLIGAHGTAKSMLLARLAQALGLSSRHYNASLVNYDDLIGYPVPGDDGSLRFVQTPASIWDAEVVFVDELSRARPDMLNRLFPIIHERVVQGMPLPKLRYRWAAMNPPATEHDDASSYLGSEPLDPALADRFGFVLAVPAWSGLSSADQDAVITSTDTPPTPEARAAVIATIDAIRREIPIVLEYAGAAITEAVREIVRHAGTLGLALSGRRAAMLYRNIAAVHAARLVHLPTADLVDSSWLALSTSIPQRAQGIAFDSTRLLAAHGSVWKTVRLDAADPRRALACEPDPVRRALRAAVLPQLCLQERSGYVADALAHLPAGGRHALGHWMVEQGHAAHLLTAVAEQCAELHALVASAQDVRQQVSASGLAYKAWRQIMAAICETEGLVDGELARNLLTGLFAKGELVRPNDTDPVLESWSSMRALLGQSANPAPVPPAPKAPTGSKVRTRATTSPR